MTRFTEFWNWLLQVNWGAWIAAMPGWGWALLAAGLVLALVSTFRRDFWKGWGNVVLIAGLLLIGLVVAIVINVDFWLIATIFFPSLAGALVGGVVGSFFSEKGTGQQCPHCGGRIVLRRYVDSETRRKRQRTACSKCGYQWHDAEIG